MSLQWTDIVNVAQLVSAIAAAFALFFLGIQVYLQRRDQKSQAIVQLYGELDAPEFREKMVFLYSKKPEDLVEAKLSRDEQAKVADVTARFEGVGFRVRKKVIPASDAVDACYLWAIRAAQQTRPHILDQRKRRGPNERPYREDFDRFIRVCKIHHLRKLHDYRLTWFLSLDDLLEIHPLEVWPPTSMAESPGATEPVTAHVAEAKVIQ